MSFHQVSKKQSFPSLLGSLIKNLNNPHQTEQGPYYLFTQEEAVRVYNILFLFYGGSGKMSISFFYNNEDTIAFRPYSKKHSNLLGCRQYDFIKVHEERIISIIKDKTVFATEEDKGIIAYLFDIDFDKMKVA
jgi:hypothetical protein